MWRCLGCHQHIVWITHWLWIWVVTSWERFDWINNCVLVFVPNLKRVCSVTIAIFFTLCFLYEIFPLRLLNTSTIVLLVLEIKRLKCIHWHACRQLVRSSAGVGRRDDVFVLGKPSLWVVMVRCQLVLVFRLNGWMFLTGNLWHFDITSIFFFDRIKRSFHSVKLKLGNFDLFKDLGLINRWLIFGLWEIVRQIFLLQSLVSRRLSW